MTMVRSSPGMASLFDGAEGMEDIAEILGRMKANVPHPASTSSKLWTLRRATRIASHHRGRETLLEKAVAMLAANGHMPGWFNQCPAASGIGDSSRNRRSNIDLVHWSEADGHARLVELKWNSDDPSEAMRQILRYGAAHLFCRAYSDRLPVRRRAVLEAREISLQVAAPARYYTASPWRDGLVGCAARDSTNLLHYRGCRASVLWVGRHLRCGRGNSGTAPGVHTNGSYPRTRPCPTTFRLRHMTHEYH